MQEYGESTESILNIFRSVLDDEYKEYVDNIYVSYYKLCDMTGQLYYNKDFLKGFADEWIGYYVKNPEVIEKRVGAAVNSGENADDEEEGEEGAGAPAAAEAAGAPAAPEAAQEERNLLAMSREVSGSGAGAANSPPREQTRSGMGFGSMLSIRGNGRRPAQPKSTPSTIERPPVAERPGSASASAHVLEFASGSSSSAPSGAPSGAPSVAPSVAPSGAPSGAPIGSISGVSNGSSRGGRRTRNRYRSPPPRKNKTKRSKKSKGRKTRSRTRNRTR